MRTLLFLYTGAGTLLFLLAVPLRLRKIPPNVFYGFRIAPAMDSERIWYDANAYAAGWLMATGAVTVATAAGLYLGAPRISIDAYALSCLGAFVGVFGLAFVRSLRRARTLAGRGE